MVRAGTSRSAPLDARGGRLGLVSGMLHSQARGTIPIAEDEPEVWAYQGHP